MSDNPNPDIAAGSIVQLNDNVINQQQHQHAAPPANNENGGSSLPQNHADPAQPGPGEQQQQQQQVVTPKSDNNDDPAQPGPGDKEPEQHNKEQQQQQQLTNPKKDEYDSMGFQSGADGKEAVDEEKTNDVVLAPSNPYLYSPSITPAGTREEQQMNRRKRLFAAKSSLLEKNPSNQKRAKRVAHKTVHPKNEVVPDHVRRRELEILGHSPLRRTKQGKKNSKKDNGNNGSSNGKTKAKPAGARTKVTGEAARKKSISDPNAPKGTAEGAAHSIEVYRGPPDEALPGGEPWPEGWVKITVERTGGHTTGRRDNYWTSPGNHKFRSKTECRKFLKALSLPEIMGDEKAAWKIFKNVQL